MWRGQSGRASARSPAPVQGGQLRGLALEPAAPCASVCARSRPYTYFFLPHDSALVPEEGFLLGCVFAIADYPEQMADKQLLATWKRVRLRPRAQGRPRGLFFPDMAFVDVTLLGHLHRDVCVCARAHMRALNVSWAFY